jgi:hypothetical protein
MKTGTKIAIGISSLVIIGGLVWFATNRNKREVVKIDEEKVKGQPDREDDDNPVEVQPVGSEYGGNVIFDSGVEGKSIDDLVKPAEKDWTQDPYYYYF